MKKIYLYISLSQFKIRIRKNEHKNGVKYKRSNMTISKQIHEEVININYSNTKKIVNYNNQ